MKYVFLMLMIVSVHIGYAQEGFENDPTSPDNWYAPRASDKDNYDFYGPQQTSGGITNTSESETSGGLTNTSNSNVSGGLTNTSNGQTSGGRTNTLAELQKPNLTVVGITNWFIQILNYIAVFLFAAALVVFLYGVFLLMFVGGTNEESRSKGKKFMFWGIVSLFVMTSTWGLVNVLKSSIFGSTKPLLGPQFK